jgi:transketolase
MEGPSVVALAAPLGQSKMGQPRAVNHVPLQMLQEKAAALRIDSVRATTEAGSGHPTSCASAADILSVLFYAVMRFDPHNPRRSDSDVFVLSKGHAAPLLYAAWAEAGAFPVEKLLTLRKFGSDLEGHPTPRLPFVDIATGSLGQGLSGGAGIAFDAKELRHSEQRVYVLMGDGESAEGSVWEAAQWAALRGLSNLCATLDINRLGQSQPTMLQHDLEVYKRRWEAFGWQALPVDGHDIPALLAAYEQASATRDRPTVVLARTLKGKGLGIAENADHWHGKALDRETANQVIAELQKHLNSAAAPWEPNLPHGPGGTGGHEEQRARSGAKPPYEVGGKEIATRKGFGDGLAALAPADPRVVVLDGDVKNSTYTEEFEKTAPDRFLQCYIAEQNMTGVAMGLAARGRVPFVATFACFLTRAYDFVRMTAISNLNVKFVGTHAGVSIGEDGPSQMGLEDLAMMCAQPNFTVLYPSDATSAWRATWLAAEHPGPCYLRTGRPASPVLYGTDERFAIGKCKVLRKSSSDRALIVAAGVTVAEALRAHEMLLEQGIATRVIDLFSVQPVDRDELVTSARDVGGIIVTVEDHYCHGGIGDVVFRALAGERIQGHRLAVGEIPRSGKPAELLEKFAINFRRITSVVQTALA